MDNQKGNQSPTSCRRHPVCHIFLPLITPLTQLRHCSSDFENKFVCGEIMAYDDLKEHGSEAAVKAAGKLRQQGKPYESTFSSDSYHVYLFIHFF